MEPESPATEPARPVRRWWEKNAFPPLFILLCLVSLAPLAASRILPLSDEPNHLSVAYILHHIDDPAARLREFYEVAVPPVPYIAYYLLVHLFAFAFGVELANKIVLGAYVLSLPIAALLWTKRTRRDPFLSLLAFPLAYSFSWSIGFHPFNVGLSLFLFATAAIDAFLERPSRGNAIAAALLALASDFGHPLAVLALYVTIPVLVIAHRPPLRRLALGSALLAPGALVFAWQVLRPRLPWALPSNPSSGGFAGEWTGTADMLAHFPQYTLDSVNSPADMVAFAVLAASFALLLGMDLFRRPSSPRLSLGELVRKYRALLVALVLFALYLAVPLHLQKPLSWWFVSGRYAPLVCFFLFLVPSGRRDGLRILAFVPALGAAFGLPVHIAREYATFGEHIRPFLRMVSRAEPSSNVLFLRMGPRTDSTVNVPIWNHFGAWVQILHGGYSNAGWFDSPTIVRVKKTLPSPPYTLHERYEHRLHAGPYRYIIVFRESRPIYLPGSTQFRVVDQEGEWKMYERVDPSQK